MTLSQPAEPLQREWGVRTIDSLRGPAGRLEALLNPGRGSHAAPLSVLLCHPHPLFAGTMHNKVVYHAMKVFIGEGLRVLRFNFRGAGRSEGTHDHGRGEQEDVHAGVAWLVREFAVPVLAAGFSFGAHMALRAGCASPDVQALVSLGTPVAAAGRGYSYDFLHSCAKPKLFLSGTADAFGARPLVEQALAAAAEPKHLAWVEGADHFFVGHLPSMQAALRGWLLATGLSQGTAAGGPQESAV